MIFGWITLIPALICTPHPERPRQRLFRDVFWKWSVGFILPVWMALWTLDVVEIFFHWQLYPPYVYFLGCHMGLATFLVFLSMKLQQREELLVLEQREQRNKELSSMEAIEGSSFLMRLESEMYWLESVFFRS